MPTTAGPTGLERLGRGALAAGGAGAALCGAGAILAPDQFYRSYLVAYVFWLGISLGCLAVVMLHHLSGGAWGIVIRRILESGMGTIPLMAVLFLPLLAGTGRLYLWARPEEVARDPALGHKAAYLNVPFFTVRAAVYFLAWAVLAALLGRWSREQDRTGDPALLRRFQLLSAPGIALLVLTVTFASVDWLMSLEPHWFSTIYGALLMVGMALSAFALAVAVLVRLARDGPLADTVTTVHLHDLGKLLFAFVMVWAYLAFSQFIITYSGNLPEEIPWYLRRLRGGWEWVGLAVALLSFGVPFFALLARSTKKNAKLLMNVALLLVAVRLVDLHWTAAPAFHERPTSLHWLDLAAPVAIGGLWLALFVRRLARSPLLPVGDPALKEAFSNE
jgi:hypothetical protein